MVGRTRILIGLSLAALAGRASAQPAPPQPSAAETAAYDAMPDTPGDGRYPALKRVEPGLPGHVVYRPANLQAVAPQALGVVLWGNGGCSDDGASARLHLAEIASHGYVVIAPGGILSGPRSPPRGPSPAPGGPLTARTTVPQVAAGLDWALAENRRRASPYFGRIDPAMIAVSGHSCGGLQALALAADPRVRTAVIHNSGVFNNGVSPISGMRIEKAALKALHSPTLYIMGGPTDIAFENGSDDFARIDTVPVALVSAPVGHGGTFHQPNGGRATAIAAAWLDWQLRGDASAGQLFVGKDCRLCRDPEWTIKRKRMD